MTEIHPGHLSTQGKRKQAILNKERLVPKDSSKVLFSHCISRSPPILWPILVQNRSHPVTLLQCQGSPKPLLHQLLNSSGPEQLIIFVNDSRHFIFSPNDIDRVRMLVRDLTIKALIPWVEKQLKLLHEVVTNRKSR